jgi:hypothetical protein
VVQIPAGSVFTLLSKSQDATVFDSIRRGDLYIVFVTLHYAGPLEMALTEVGLGFVLVPPQHEPTPDSSCSLRETQGRPLSLIRSVVPIYRYFVDRFDEIRK